MNAFGRGGRFSGRRRVGAEAGVGGSPGGSGGDLRQELDTLRVVVRHPTWRSKPWPSTAPASTDFDVASYSFFFSSKFFGQMDRDASLEGHPAAPLVSAPNRGDPRGWKECTSNINVPRTRRIARPGTEEDAHRRPSRGGRTTNDRPRGGRGARIHGETREEATFAVERLGAAYAESYRKRWRASSAWGAPHTSSRSG